MHVKDKETSRLSKHAGRRIGSHAAKL